MKHVMLKSLVCAMVLVLVPLSVHADPPWSANAWKVWFPYVTVFNRDWDQNSPPWLDTWMVNIHDSSIDNPVWDPDTDDSNDSDVENIYYPYNGGRQSYFDRSGGHQGFRFAIHNHTATDYTGDYKVRIAFFTASGAQVDESTTWSNGTTYLVNTSPSGNFSWDSTNDYFECWLPAGRTAPATLFWKSGGTEMGLFNTPSADDNETFKGSMCMWQDGGGKFMAYYRGSSHGHWREDDGAGDAAFSDHWYDLSFGHNGIREDRYDNSGADNTVIRPQFLEKSYLTDMSTTPAQSSVDQSEIIYIVNASDSQDTIEVTAYLDDGTEVEKDGGTPDGTYSITLQPYARWQFMPSQFFHEDADRYVHGYLEIIGKRPVATAFSLYHARTADQVGDHDYQHFPSGQMIPLCVKNDF